MLRAALTWAYDERLIDQHPLRLMRGPARTSGRGPLTDTQVRALLMTAELRLLEAHANDCGQEPVNHPASAGLGGLHRAEQDLLLVRLAADTGARRGELAALRVDDLDGRRLRIERAVSAGQLTCPKSGHGRVLTLGADTAALWHSLAATWAQRLLDAHPSDRAVLPEGLGPWLFAADRAHRRRLGAEVLGHRFACLREAADVPGACLHRLRHTVATFLVARGEVLHAQARLGHADAATTLREYSHVLPATDGPIADAINTHLGDALWTLPQADFAEGINAEDD